MLLPKYFSKAMNSRFNPFRCQNTSGNINSFTFHKIRNIVGEKKRKSWYKQDNHFGVPTTSTSTNIVFAQILQKESILHLAMQPTKTKHPFTTHVCDTYVYFTMLSLRETSICMARLFLPDLEQIRTLSPAFKNSLANAYPIPGLKKHKKQMKKQQINKLQTESQKERAHY